MSNRKKPSLEPTAAQADPTPAAPPVIEDGWADLDHAPVPEAEPWWEVTAPEHGLPRREIQAPTAEVAKERYLLSMNLRAVKPTVKRVQ